MHRKTVSLLWEGSIFVHHSLAMVNREILRLLRTEPRLSLSILPYEPDQFKPSPKFSSLIQCMNKKLSSIDICVRHRWPPVFNRIGAAKHIVFQPWEYGSVPVQWIEPLKKRVDEIWVPSSWVKEAFVKSGIDEQSIQVIPQGVDPEEFRPDAVPPDALRERIGSRFCFFFNGGVNGRKGADILVNAYLNEFHPEEPVCLLIKDSTFYNGPLAQQVAQLAQRSDIAPIIYIRHNLYPQDLPGLYTACNCYVQPYRAEGFGLPIAEAMACALPTIVPFAGPCPSFTTETTSYYIRSTRVPFREKKVINMETVDYPFWHVPDIDHVRFLMRHVYEHPDEAREKGKTAREYIQRAHTWKHAAAFVRQRVSSLTE